MVKSAVNVKRRSSICWRGRRELTDVRKPEIMVMTSVCRRRAIYWLLRSPSRKLVTLNPKLKSTSKTFTASFRWWDAYRKQLGLKDFSPKSQDAVALQRIKERGALPMVVVVISVRQSTVATISGLHCRALVMVSSSIRLTAWLQNSKKRAERSERLMYEQVTAIISALVICIIVCLSWAVNHYRDNAITYKQRDKNARELKLANAAITDMQMRQRDVAALDAKYTKS